MPSRIIAVLAAASATTPAAIAPAMATPAATSAAAPAATSPAASAATASAVAARATFAPAVAAPAADAARRRCTVRDRRVNESSGLAASRRHPGIVYTLNDSDGPTQIYALGPDCRTTATLTVGNAQNRDWEAIAPGPDGIYIGDIGDNLNSWPYVTVYRIPEPAVLRSRRVRATAYRIKYADGPRNAETLMIDPRTGRLYIASKEFGGGLYEGPRRLRTSGFNIMRRIGDAPLYATDGAFSPDGRTFVIRTYWDAQIYSAPGKALADVSVPRQKLGEGIAYSADGRSLLLSSEGVNQPLWELPVPRKALPPPRGRAGAPAAAPVRESRKGFTTLVLLIAGALALVGGTTFARRRRS